MIFQLKLSLMLLFSFGTLFLSAQKVLQIETYGKAQTEKLYLDTEITYQLKNDPYWYTGVIQDLLVDQKLISMGSYYVSLDSIRAIRFSRGKARALGTSLFLFGVAWSGFAAVGTLTDGIPETRYRWSDAIVSGTSMLLGFLIPKIFRYKVVKFGKRKRLRMLDLGFSKRIGP